MTTYTLHLIRNGQTEKIVLSPNQAFKIQANDEYQLVDEKGKIIELITEKKGDDIWIYAEQQDAAPELIIQQQNSTHYVPHESTATHSSQLTQPQTVATQTNHSGKILGMLVGGLAIGGLAAAGGGGSNGVQSSTNQSTTTDTPQTPTTEEQPLITAKGESVKAEPLPEFDGEISIKGESVKAEPLPEFDGEISIKGESVKAEPLPEFDGEISIKGESVKAEPLPEFDGEISIKGESVKAEPLPEFDGEISIKGESVKAEPLPEFDGEISIKGESVKAEPLPEGKLPNIITITSIDDDNIITPDELEPQLHSQTYTLTGKVDLSETSFTKFKNRDLIDKVILKIDGKEYQADYDSTNDTFTLTLNPAEAAAVNGQTISEFSLTTTSDWIPETLGPVKEWNLQWGPDNPIQEDYYIWDSSFQNDIKPTLSKEMFSLDTNDVVQLNNGIYTIKTADLAERTTKISGSLNGEETANQSVDIEINGKHFTVTTDSTGQFTLDVATHELTQDEDQQLIATWQVDGKTITDTASFIVAKNQDNAGEFVSHHQEMSVDEMPYFMQALHVGPHRQINGKIGAHETLNLTYHYNTKEETQELLSKGSYTESLYEYDYAVSQDNIDVTEQVLNEISYYTNIQFTYSNQPNSDIDFILHDFIYPNAGYSVLGYAYIGGDKVFMNARYFHFNPDTNESHTFKTNPAYGTLAHEFLHLLGEGHAMDGDRVLPQAEANTPKLTGQNGGGFFMYDLVYLHYLYGVNPNQRVGNDVYTFKPFNRQSFDNDVYIWDGAGVDTFDASTEAQGVTVNLTPGSWIYSGDKSDNFITEQVIASRDMTDEELVKFFDVKDGSTFAGYRPSVQGETIYTTGQAFIGYDTQLENLIGSNHNDTLTGNNTHNLIIGLDGNDTIDGGQGDDDLHGSAGNDTLMGGEGNDRLNGGMGHDVLTGGAGDDVFVFSSLLENHVDVIQDFGVGNDKIELSANIFHRVNTDMTHFDQYIQFDKTSGQLSYDADGLGDGVAVHFATLEHYTGDLTQNQFVIV